MHRHILAGAVLLLALSACSSNQPAQVVEPTHIATSDSAILDPSTTPSTEDPATSASPTPESTNSQAFIAVCDIAVNLSGGQFDPTISYFDPSTGSAINTVSIVSPYSTSFYPSGSGDCSTLNYNGDLSMVAGIDQSTGVPAEFSLTDGSIKDMAPPAKNGGFDAPTSTQFYVGETFNPLSDDFWYELLVSDDTGITATVAGPNGYQKSYKLSSEPYDTASGTPDLNGQTWCWPTPLVATSTPSPCDGSTVLNPDGSVTKLEGGQLPKGLARLWMDKDLLPSSQYSLTSIRYSDDHTRAAFTAEPPNSTTQLSLWSVPASGGEPVQLNPSLDVPLNLFNVASVIRYTSS